MQFPAGREMSPTPFKPESSIVAVAFQSISNGNGDGLAGWASDGKRAKECEQRGARAARVLKPAARPIRFQPPASKMIGVLNEDSGEPPESTRQRRVVPGRSNFKFAVNKE